MATDSKFGLLVELARETGAEKRRELLMTITDAFLYNASSRSDVEGALYDDVVAAITSDLSTTVRSELAKRLAGRSGPLSRTALRLALDVIEVAQPVIERSPALAEADLIKVVTARGDDHQVAVTRRSNLPESVSSALVERGSDKVLASLLGNQTARIDRATYERVAERAFKNVALHIPFVRHRRIPPDLLQEIFLTVEKSLRDEILDRFRDLDPSELEAAMDNGRKQLSHAYASAPDDMEAARIAVDRLEAIGRLRPAALISLLRDDQRTAFLVAFSRLTAIEFAVVVSVVDSRDIDALATLCRSASFERALFLSLAMEIGGQYANAALARELGQLYDDVPVEAARRVVRFWKVRSKDASRSAAA